MKRCTTNETGVSSVSSASDLCLIVKMGVLRALLLLLVAAAASAALVKRQDSEEAIVYKLFHVDSLVVSRYAVTSITSVVQNSDPEQSKELEFRMQLPETAFISNFSM